MAKLNIKKIKTRHDWTTAEIGRLFSLPFTALLHQAMTIHHRCFSGDANAVQISALYSLQTGRCTENCAYCAQSIHYPSPIEAHELRSVTDVENAAKVARQNGATRFCMAAAGSGPSAQQFPEILAMIKKVKVLGMEACMSLGMLDGWQVRALKEAGLDYYNHNIDTSPSYYAKIITTRTYKDRLDTLKLLRDAGIKICCGGIVGMGESAQDRVEFLRELANFPQHPHSVPINRLIPMPATPLANVSPIDPLDIVRTIAVARILMPYSRIRLAGGRETMSDELQALCFCAGVNSIFCGEKLLTTANTAVEKDRTLLQRLGMKINMADVC
jgi:biotin synthase